MSILQTITVMIILSSVVLALILAEDAKNILNNKKPDIQIKTSSPIAVTQLTEITPIPNQTKYTTDGTFQTSLETRSTVALTIKEIIISDPFLEEDCLMLTNNTGKKLTQKKNAILKARCQQITTGNPYKLSINITYTQAGSDEIKQQLGTIKGTAEELTE
jgi:hypothetical protein